MALQGGVTVSSSSALVGDAVLVVDDLAQLRAGKTYQVWVVTHGGTPTSAGLFAGSGGQNVVPVGVAVPSAAVVAVTVEQAGGAKQPTTRPIVASLPA